MPRYLITEVCEYTVEAANYEEAEEIFLSLGPVVEAESPVHFIGVCERVVEEA